MDNKGVRIVGMVWYQPEHYDAAKAIMTDQHKFHASYHLWRMDAERGEKHQRRLGITVIRAYIDPATFPDWCAARGLNIDAHARNQFAAFVAYQIATGGENGGGMQ